MIKYFAVLANILFKNQFSRIKFSWSSFQPWLASVMKLKFRRIKFSRPLSDLLNPRKISTSKILGYMVVCDHVINYIVHGSHSTVGRVLIAWFNDCVLGRSGQIANPIIAMIDLVPYTRMFMFANLLIANTGNPRNSQLIDTRN